MADLTRTITGIEHCLGRYVDGLCDDCPYMGAIDKTYTIPMKCKEIIMRDALELLKELKGLTLALEQANATINYLNEEKEKAIKEIEERKAFNLRCEGKPGWLMKGIDVGFNTALDILKDKDGKQE